jgi:hypothetical protein
MNTPKFTKGPWTVAGLAIYEADHWKDGNNLGGRLLYVAPDEDHRPDAEFEDEELEANARLIAAAPELYEALESAMKTAEFEKHPFRPWHDRARAALAKAIGGERK